MKLKDAGLCVVMAALVIGLGYASWRIARWVNWEFAYGEPVEAIEERVEDLERRVELLEDGR